MKLPFQFMLLLVVSVTAEPDVLSIVAPAAMRKSCASSVMAVRHVATNGSVITNGIWRSST